MYLEEHFTEFQYITSPAIEENTTYGNKDQEHLTHKEKQDTIKHSQESIEP